MKVRNIAVTVALTGLSLLASAGVYYGLSKWQASRPTSANLGRAMQNAWQAAIKKQSTNAELNPGETLCVYTPTQTQPDAQSRIRKAMGSHVDFRIEDSPSKDRRIQLAQFDALSKVGFFHKSSEIVDIDGTSKSVVRYALTDKGWKTQGFSRGTCFEYGKAKYLRTIRTESIQIPNSEFGSAYKVHFATGLGSESEMSDWARDPDVQRAFPQIAASLQGNESIGAVTYKHGEWIDLGLWMNEKSRNPEDVQNQLAAERLQQSDENQREIAELKKLPDPTVEEIKEVLSRMHGHGTTGKWPNGCAYLPGSEKLPVDISLTTPNPPHYSIGISTIKERTSYDKVAKKTIPYISALEQLGVLVKLPANRPNSILGADVYELATQFQPNLNPLSPTCLQMGEATVNIVDVQINPEGRWLDPSPSFQYKLRITYKSPPPWTSTPLIKAGWAELRGALEQGMACQGQFSFDKKKRDAFGGMGSCWWAFDSYYENY